MVDSFFTLPRFYDTTAANLHKSVDTCGAMFFSYSDRKCWIRDCTPKRWVLMSGDYTILSQSNVTGGLRNYGAITTGADNLGLGYDLFNTLTTGNRNINIGRNSNRRLTTASDMINLGFSNNINVNESNLNSGAGITIGKNNNGYIKYKNLIIGETNVGSNVDSATSQAFSAIVADNMVIGVENLINLRQGIDNMVFSWGGLETLDSGHNNNVFGQYGLPVLLYGKGNNAFGFKSGRRISRGDKNTFIGDSSGNGSSSTIMYNTTFLGSQTRFTGTNLFNRTAVGDSALVAQDNFMALGRAGTRVGIGRGTASEQLHLDSAIIIGPSVGSNDGTIRYASNIFEGRENGVWVPFGGGAPTLQQVFDVETGEAAMNKNDTINNGAFALNIRSLTTSASVGGVNIFQYDGVSKFGNATIQPGTNTIQTASGNEGTQLSMISGGFGLSTIALHAFDNDGRTKSTDLKVFPDSLYIHPTTQGTLNMIVSDLPNKASLAGTDSILIQDINDKVWKVPNAAAGAGVTTMAAIGSSPNANGATISGSTLTLQPGDASFGGVLSTSTQDIVGQKNFSSGVTFAGGNVSFPGGSANVGSIYLAGAQATATYRGYLNVGGYTLGASENGGNYMFLAAKNAITEAASGTHNLFANVVVDAPVLNNGAGATTNGASLYVLGSPKGTATITNNYALWVDSSYSRFDGRVILTQGADVASVAGAITVTDGNSFEITGTNAITRISNIGWQNGSEITLIFTSTASLTDGTANSGTDIGMKLNANANFTGSADDLVTLVLCEIGGTQRWREKCKSVN